jgi:hypothetical protein
LASRELKLLPIKLRWSEKRWGQACYFLATFCTDFLAVPSFFLQTYTLHKLYRDFNAPEAIKERVENKTGIQGILVLLNAFAGSIKKK